MKLVDIRYPKERMHLCSHLEYSFDQTFYRILSRDNSSLNGFFKDVFYALSDTIVESIVVDSKEEFRNKLITFIDDKLLPDDGLISDKIAEYALFRELDLRYTYFVKYIVKDIFDVRSFEELEIVFKLKKALGVEQLPDNLKGFVDELSRMFSCTFGEEVNETEPDRSS